MQLKVLAKRKENSQLADFQIAQPESTWDAKEVQ